MPLLIKIKPIRSRTKRLIRYRWTYTPEIRSKSDKLWESANTLWNTGRMRLDKAMVSYEAGQGRCWSSVVYDRVELAQHIQNQDQFLDRIRDELMATVFRPPLRMDIVLSEEEKHGLLARWSLGAVQ